MYQGYRLKIDSVKFPDIYIQKESYSCIESKRVIETWTDANMVEHEITTGVPKATITFSIAEHPMERHASIIAFFQKENDITVEYFSDRTNSYRTANCRLEPITFAHKHAVGNNVLYAAASVTLIEN